MVKRREKREYPSSGMLFSPSLFQLSRTQQGATHTKSAAQQHPHCLQHLIHGYQITVYVSLRFTERNNTNSGRQKATEQALEAST